MEFSFCHFIQIRLTIILPIFPVAVKKRAWKTRKDGGRRAEVRSQRTEVRSQKAEVRSQRAEIRGQRAEVGSHPGEIRCSVFHNFTEQATDQERQHRAG